MIHRYKNSHPNLELYDGLPHYYNIIYLGKLQRPHCSPSLEIMVRIREIIPK